MPIASLLPAGLADRASSLAQECAQALMAVSPLWLALSLIALLAAQSVRQLACWGVLRAAAPQTTLDRRALLRCFWAANGLNSVTPVRGGDALRLVLLHRRDRDLHYPTLAATLVPENLVELLIASALISWLLLGGWVPLSAFDPTNIASPQTMMLLGGLAVSLVIAALAAHRLRRIWREMLAGLRVLGQPRVFVREVVGWQLAARALRLLSYWALLSAFSLPDSLLCAALLMAVQSSSRLLGVGMTATAAKAVLVAYALGAASGTEVGVALAASMLIVGALAESALNVALSLVLLPGELGTRSPRQAWRLLRRLPAPSAPLAADAV